MNSTVETQDRSARLESSRASTRREDLGGTALGLLAFLIWGLFPIYFYYLRDVNPLITLAFRAIFTTVLLAPVVLFCGNWRNILTVMRRPAYDLGLFITMATTATSWGMFIWLVTVNHTLYASLGNYVCPLVTVAFGAIIFRERPTRLQYIAIFLALAAVVVFAFGVGRFPWESALVAVVFAVYSVLRKKMDVDSSTALSVETIFAFPLATAYLVYALVEPRQAPQWATSASTVALLVGGGALTAIPLLLFGSAARRCKLSTLGILNYLTPTGQFLCGVYFLNEATTTFQWISFILIWCALAAFTTDLILSERQVAKPE